MTAPGDQPLTFGTAGLRGPMRPGPGGMNVETVTAATWGLAKVLEGQRPRRVDGSWWAAMRATTPTTSPGYRRSACRRGLFRHPAARSRPDTGGGVRGPRLGAAAGVQITASHNPPADNGYKVYLDGGMQIVPPTDRDIEAAMAAAPHGRVRAPRSAPTGTELIVDYVRRAAGVRRTTGARASRADRRCTASAASPPCASLHEAGIDDVHVVAEQFAPDGDFPTVAFPNPGGAGRDRPAAGPGRRGRSRRRHRAGSRRRPMRGRHSDDVGVADALAVTKPVGC